MVEVRQWACAAAMVVAVAFAALGAGSASASSRYAYGPRSPCYVYLGLWHGWVPGYEVFRPSLQWALLLQ